MKILIVLTAIIGLSLSSVFGLTPIPIQFSHHSKLPVIQVTIEGNLYYFELDTGAAGEMIVKKEILNRLQNKIHIGDIKTVDINGNIYENSEFVTSDVKIGNLHFESMTARQEDLTFLTKGCIVRYVEKKEKESDSATIAGRIGWGTLKNRQWYFDFSHSFLWIAEDFNELQKCLSISDYVQVPFELEEIGIILSMDTAIGRKRFLLDTGANVSCLRESLVNKKYAKEFEPGKWIFVSKLKINRTNLGNHPFFLYNFTPMLDVDGILSIQFFEKNGIYLDFQRKKALIVPSKRPFWERAIERAQDLWKIVFHT